MGAKPKPEAAEADRLFSPQAPPRAAARLASEADAASESPARRLQEQLEWSLADEAGETDRWSRRRAAAFVVVTCGSFWIAAALLARLAARALGCGRRPRGSGA